MKKLCSIFLVCLLVVSVTGCGKKKPPPKPVEQPVELTPEQIYERDFAPIVATMRPMLSMDSVPDAQVGSTVSSCQAKIRANQAKENGKKAVRHFAGAVEEIMLEARDQEKWKMVVLCFTIYTAANPGSKTHAKLAERATKMLAKPEVNLTGFFDLDGDLFVFLEVYDPTTNEQETYKVRETEVFHNGMLKLTRVIGRRSAVELEYIPMNYLWTVPWED